MGSKYIGRLSVDWTLKNITQGNEETFYSTHPMNWHKAVGLWLPTAFSISCPIKPLVERSSRSTLFIDHGRKGKIFSPLGGVSDLISFIFFLINIT